MGFNGCHQIFRIRRDIARQQRRGQHLLAITPGHNRADGGAAEHHDQADFIFRYHLLITLKGFFDIVAVVIGDHFNGVIFAANVYAARSIDIIGNNLTAIQSR